MKICKKVGQEIKEITRVLARQFQEKRGKSLKVKGYLKNTVTNFISYPFVFPNSNRGELSNLTPSSLDVISGLTAIKRCTGPLLGKWERPGPRGEDLLLPKPDILKSLRKLEMVWCGYENSRLIVNTSRQVHVHLERTSGVLHSSR